MQKRIPLEEKKLFRKSIVFPILFISILWAIKLAEEYFHLNLIAFSIRPRTVEGLLGIFTSPLIHGSYDHLLSNTLPLLVVGTGIIYFYRDISVRVIFMIWLFCNSWVWLAARPSAHIGASGLIYGFVCFMFFSGVLRPDKRLLAISLLVTFLYGSLVWGILPVKQSISWEAHLFGSIAGILAAVYFRKEGPQQKPKVWEDEAEPTEPQYWMTEEQKKKVIEKYGPPPADTTVNYIYKEKKDSG
jgi:membrane associated rhomboid family serine protease